MKTVWIVLGIVALAVVLVVAGLWIGASWVRGGLGSDWAGYGPMGRGMMGPGVQGYGPEVQGYGPGMMGGSGVQGYGPGMMGPGVQGYGPGVQGRNWAGLSCGAPGTASGVQQGTPNGCAYVTPGQGAVASLDEAKAAIERYLQSQDYTGLTVHEVMEFEHNYYAIVSEPDTGIGAMELLVDKDSGAVGPEPGPNMMWNAKYGMMAGSGMMGGGGMMGRGGMMGGPGVQGYDYGTGAMSVSAAQAEEIAQRWLDANLPGRTAGEADPFYGYYTLHFLKDGKVDGMLSVNGSTGDVWYHSWHGAFIQMIEEEG